MTEELTPRSADQSIPRIIGISEGLFASVESGRKTAELRSGIHIFATIKPGYILEIRTLGSNDSIKVKVKEIRKYKTLAEVFAAEDMEKIFPDMSGEAINLYAKINLEGKEVAKNGLIVMDFEKVPTKPE